MKYLVTIRLAPNLLASKKPDSLDVAAARRLNEI